MIYCFIADGSEEIEAITTVDILRRAGIDVRTVSVNENDGNTVLGSHNIKIICDLTVSETETDKLEGVILPGGMPGTLNLEKSDRVKELVRYCADNKLYTFAICAAPSVLGHMGILKGRRATCYPGFEGELIGAEYVNEPAVRDGKVITSKGPGCTVDFAMMIVEALKGEEVMNKLRDSMQCH